MAYWVKSDTREQCGWTFEKYDKCLGTEVGTLKFGDYTIKGMEDIVCLERKGCVSEISTNLGKEVARFRREFEKMRHVKHKYIICEFSCSELLKFPEGAGIPRQQLKLVRMTGKSIMKALLEFQMEYDVNFIFCDNPHNAFVTASSIMKRIYERYSDG